MTGFSGPPFEIEYFARVVLYRKCTFPHPAKNLLLSSLYSPFLRRATHNEEPSIIKTAGCYNRPVASAPAVVCCVGHSEQGRT